MLLLNGERILLQSEARSREPSLRGILFLTNYRLVFERHTKGLLQAGPSETVFQVPLEDVHNAHVSGPRVRLPVVGRELLTLETTSGRHELTVANPREWHHHLTEIRSKFHPASPSPAGSPSSPVVVTVQPATSPPQVMFRCRHCNHVYHETAGKCPNCGAPF